MNHAMDNAEKLLSRWQTAGLLDAATAEAIRSYEATQAKPHGKQWQVLVALILGGILLGAGVLLFVAAHWNAVSPWSRFALVLAMLVFFHGLGMGVRGRFAGLSTAMYAVGSIAAGAAIALVGQIFNMQEHWPAAVMLWGLCAAAGWWLLRDPFQQTLTLLLVPAWLISEWAERAGAYAGNGIYLTRILAVLAAVYLTAFLQTRKRAVFGILFSVGAIMLAIATEFLSEGWLSFNYGNQWGFVPLHLRIAALVLILLTMLAGYLLDKKSTIPVAVIACVVYLLPWAQTVLHGGDAVHPWSSTGPSLLFYILVSATAIFLIWWGVSVAQKALVNYGMVAFALTVFWFYFSSVMDMLGRSLGLIGMGILFLAGGWFLEKTRRKLVTNMQGGAL